MAENESIFTTVTTRLENVLQPDNRERNINIIRDFVLRMFRVRVHVMLFLKAFLLSIYDEFNNRGEEIDFEQYINKNVISIIQSLIVVPPAGTRRDLDAAIYVKLEHYYREWYEPTRDDNEIPISGLHLSESLKYEANNIIKDYNNNIIQRYASYLTKYFDTICQKRVVLIDIDDDEDLTALQKKERKTEFLRNLNLYSADMFISIFEVAPDGSNRFHYRSVAFDDDTNDGNELRIWLDEQKQICLPEWVRNQPSGFDIRKALKDHPLRFEFPMITMMKYVEAAGEKLYKCFPLCTSSVPTFCLIDTFTIIQLLWVPTEDILNTKGRAMSRTEIKAGGNLKTNQTKIWNQIFVTTAKNKHLFDGVDPNNPRIQDPAFPDDPEKTIRNYLTPSSFTFHHQMECDGEVAKFHKCLKSESEKLQPKNPKKDPTKRSTPYVTDPDFLLSIEGLNNNNPRIAAFDINERDRIYGVNSDIKEQQSKVRLTSDEVNKSSKTKIYRKLLKEEKTDYRINNRNIFQHQEILDHHNSKTVNESDFLRYCAAKNHVNFVVGPFYVQQVYRKRRFKKFIGIQKCHARLEKRIKAAFGSPDQVVLAYGDSCVKQNASLPGAGLLKVLIGMKYKCCLVNEWGTSVQCSCGRGRNEKFRWVKNPKPKTSNTILCHGLLRCQTCKSLWNRDLNAAINIWRIARNAIIFRVGRPLYLINPNANPDNNDDADDFDEF